MGLHPVILAGGPGTRLWPLSRETCPKPFLNINSERSMLQEAVRRLDGIDDVAAAIVVCNEEHRFLVAEHIGQADGRPLTIILEPTGRNTAPALTLAALSLADRGHQDQVMLVTPADHLIQDVAAFRAAVQLGAAIAETGRMVTLGIVPTGARTGYGYIKKGRPWRDLRETLPEPDNGENRHGTHGPMPFSLEEFVEKPDRATAERMVKSKRYLWNSGIFIMRVSMWLEQVRRHRPDIAEKCRSAYMAGHADGNFYRPDAQLFTDCPSDSIDYAVMEKAAADRGASSTESVVIPLDAGWSDVGAWSALREVGSRDDDGNVIQGDVYARATSDSLLIGQHRLVAAIGLDKMIVVETPDAVLVAHRDHEQDVKGLVETLKREGRPEPESPPKVHRPWGSYETVDAGARFKVKRLAVNPGASLSLQTHEHRAEHWVVVRGTARITRGDEQFTLGENQSTYIPVGTKHRLENPGADTLEVVEVQSGSYLEEDDIVRLEDRYNRHK